MEPEAALVLDRLAPVLSGASGAAAVDDAFAVGFEFNPHVVEAALGPASLPAEEIAGEIRLGWSLGHVRPLESESGTSAGRGFGSASEGANPQTPPLSRTGTRLHWSTARSTHLRLVADGSMIGCEFTVATKVVENDGEKRVDQTCQGRQTPT